MTYNQALDGIYFLTPREKMIPQAKKLRDIYEMKKKATSYSHL